MRRRWQGPFHVDGPAGRTFSGARQLSWIWSILPSRGRPTGRFGARWSRIRNQRHEDHLRSRIPRRSCVVAECSPVPDRRGVGLGRGGRTSRLPRPERQGRTHLRNRGCGTAFDFGHYRRRQLSDQRGAHGQDPLPGASGLPVEGCAGGVRSVCRCRSGRLCLLRGSNLTTGETSSGGVGSVKADWPGARPRCHFPLRVRSVRAVFTKSRRATRVGDPP